MDLKQIDASVWTTLSDAAADPQAEFRYLTLCTVDAASRPQARTVVLRQVDSCLRTLTFHTDLRSPKWQEMSANPQVTVLGYALQTRLQLRLQGEVGLYAGESDIADAAWSRLPARTRSTYTGGPPGELSDSDEQAAVPPADDDAGRQHFGVVVMRVSALDWYQLHRENNQRALLIYATDGALVSGQQIAP
ncbi:MAG: pyridoxamine 5'-phosphate oxidase family protein [Pantoea sp.]|uniref:Pyridoxamine 5'-phosphate oxidase n=1 Tax=Pantoea brenneri TaxID=472694 RepID=A0AAX3JC09_9GAMM|nr:MULTISPECIES: pyridoxamine 5'-phosphate oxidase family protein [Pantoea]MBS6034273.1 pyridoxamine 5'-phosphate oxidase family protein [Pantoea sp.]MDH2124671.1 pyridoxamine 5'-phosphate oxidase family protein [Pantoea brenneri]VXC56018.1 Pyridoxamine 5'-phosphate oxidase [Pantoea brenneri]